MRGPKKVVSCEGEPLPEGARVKEWEFKNCWSAFTSSPTCP